MDAWAPVEPGGTVGQRKPGFVAGDVLGILAGVLLLIVLGLQMVQAYELFFGEPGDFEVRAVDLWANSALILIVFGLLPWLWVLTTRQDGWQGMLDYFALRATATTVAKGAGLGILLVVGLMLIAIVLNLLGLAQENEAIGPIQAVLSLPLVLAISLSAAFGEELLFRGIVQKYIGLWPQAIVFGLLHAYQGVFGILLTFGLAVLFGYILKRGYSLWIPIAAHFMFDFVQLALLLAAPEVG